MITNVSGLLKTYGAYTAEKPKASAKSNHVDGNKDTVALSDKALDYQSVRKALQNIPDVREDLVASIKSRMESNTYSVSASDIAEKLMGKI